MENDSEADLSGQVQRGSGIITMLTIHTAVHSMVTYFVTISMPALLYMMLCCTPDAVATAPVLVPATVAVTVTATVALAEELSAAMLQFFENVETEKNNIRVSLFEN
jgi:hypothetical protein